jgi:hypothetical protein
MLNKKYLLTLNFCTDYVYSVVISVSVFVTVSSFKFFISQRPQQGYVNSNKQITNITKECSEHIDKFKELFNSDSYNIYCKIVLSVVN